MEELDRRGVAHAQAAQREPTPHSATRISVAPDLSYDMLIARFESTVPPLPLAHMQEHLNAGNVAAVRTLLEKGSPVGVYVFYALDATPFMAAAGHAGKAKSYLVGNPLIAEKMFAHDPGAMLYAPRRSLNHADKDHTAHLTLDRPSDLFASFGNPDIAATGTYLDAAVANVLSTMEIAVPSALSA
jgi:hypothetical protein